MPGGLSADAGCEKEKKKLYSPDGWHQGRADDPHPSSSRGCEMKMKAERQ